MISRMYHSFLHWKIGKLLFSSHSYLYNQSIPFHTLTYLHTKKMAMSVVSSNYMINPSLPSLLSFSESPTTKTNISLKLKSSYKSYSYTKYETRKRDPDPKKSALLVIDMQNYFSSIAKPILHNTLTTIHLCRHASIPIFFTRHCHKSPSDYGMLAEWWNNDLIFEGSVDAKLMPEIKRLAGVDEVIDKSTYSAFHNTKLQDLLVERGVNEVIVSGVMTNVCCETTAREAFLRGYRVFFLTDATATVDEELHLGTLRNLAFAFAYLVDCKRLQAGLLGIKM